MKVDYIGTQWPLGPDKGPSAASHPAGCVFLISHCFSLREGHLLIDCLNLLRINTAGSLCDAYPKHPLTPPLSLPVSAASQRVVRENERLHQISAHFLIGPLSWPVPFISPSLWGLWIFLITKKPNRPGKSTVDHTTSNAHIIDTIYELWN